jgi:deoxyribonuclease V
VRLNQVHPWGLNPREAIALQRQLACRVSSSGDPHDVRRVAAADVAYLERAPAWAASTARVAVVVMSYPTLEVVEQVVVEAPVRFPYVPGLLSFRETPALAEAFERVVSTPDLLLIDGHGYSHPRRFGLACHMGLMTGVPTIGCAKSRLCGEALEPATERGASAVLHDHGEPIGIVLRTKARAKPLYVSTGHLVSASAAAKWVLRLSPTHRIPEPARIADVLSKGRRVENQGRGRGASPVSAGDPRPINFAAIQ